MNKKESIFVFYDLGLSLPTLSRLYREADEEQLNRLLKGDFLELQFSLSLFNDKELELLSSIDFINKSKNNISKVLNEFVRENIKYFIYFEEKYPRALKNISSPPFFIFLKGNADLLDNKFICSIVGTRKPTEKTLKKIDATVKEMVEKNIVVASGLALGTDIQAHKSTVNNNGETIAVLPGPINKVVPKSHEGYAKEIVIKNGLLISEYYRSNSNFTRMNYINRNRIISGISNAVIIAECSEKSGTMHTARYAYKQNKPLYCFNNESTGVRKILASRSAKVYTNSKDIIEN